MYQMLIVDDNNKDRRILQSIINWERFGIKVVEEAVNGAEALQKIEQNTPDIIITDIFMPVMNGIDMVSVLREKYENIKIIFMSFSEEFEIAKSAIDMSVYGYIVKPIRKNEVERAIEKVLSVYHREEKDAQEKRNLLLKLEKALPVLQESFIRDLLFGVYRQGDDILQRFEFLGFPRYQKMFIEVYCIRERKGAVPISIPEQYSVMYFLKEQLTMQNQQNLAYVVQTSSLEFIVLHISSKESEQFGLEYIMQVYPILTQIFSDDFVVGISNQSQQIADIHSLFKQACKAADAIFYNRQIPVVLYQEIAESETDISINIDELYHEMDELLLMADDHYIEVFLEKRLMRGESKNGQYLRYQAVSIINVLQIILLEKEKNINGLMEKIPLAWKEINEIHSVAELIHSLEAMILEVKKSFFDYNQSRNGQLVNQIKQYIREHYQEQIGVEEISQKVFMSSKQVNNVFRKETGQSVFEYLVEYRIRVAKNLLTNPDARINEVAYQVGYTNTSHFNLVFKKHTGKTPREFREQYT